ncbi:la-related protein 4 isoform X2 [Trichomycterus rosablanca]|uniref:la-related protein 4 isoform X2 n=1 Tax=Trichomycterus rosablanca TaxID=2290929 RepID=UPI002F34F62F
MISEQRGVIQQNTEQVQSGSFLQNHRTTTDTNKHSDNMVTTKGTGLNPNAKVWQEVSAPPSQNSEESTESLDWPQAVHTPVEHPEGCKGFGLGYADSECAAPVESTLLNGATPAELAYPVYESEGEVTEELQPMSDEGLKESLKKELEFCFSRENLSKDLYLVSQMDSDQFVSIWTIANMEGIKRLTTDMDLLLEVLRASPVVQVDEKGEKVRPNNKRCIIILREVPETTPVEEVEALFKSEKCPQVISVEFAHNNNWYITFQSDTDAQQAYKYLREEVKTFQGKPIMARIKAINTFFAKNGYGAVESMYTGSPQSQYSSPVYLQQVYQPQQYPVYGLLPQTWSPSPTPYFETPLAPFPNSQYVNGFGTAGNYKTGSSPVGLTRHFPRNRNHVKLLPRSDGPSQSDGFTGLSSLQTPQTPTSDGVSSFDPPLSPNESIYADLAGNTRARRGSYRGMRRRREDDRMRPLQMTEIKTPPVNFDLATSNFPPLPGGVAGVVTGGAITSAESVLENRMADVVKGINRDKQLDIVKREGNKDSQPAQEEVPSSVLTSSPLKPTAEPQQTPALSVSNHATKPDDSPTSKDTILSPAAVPSTPVQSAPASPIPLSKPAQSPMLSTSAQESRKLSYAEVCQKPRKDPPPTPVPCPDATPSPTSNQPLRELRVNKAEAPAPTTTPSEKTEKGGEGRPPREHTGYRRGNAGRGAGFKLREQQRWPPQGRRSSPQSGWNRRSGKEQNIPPRLPK